MWKGKREKGEELLGVDCNLSAHFRITSDSLRFTGAAS